MGLGLFGGLGYSTLDDKKLLEEFPDSKDYVAVYKWHGSVISQMMIERFFEENKKEILERCKKKEEKVDKEKEEND